MFLIQLSDKEMFLFFFLYWPGRIVYCYQWLRTDLSLCTVSWYVDEWVDLERIILCMPASLHTTTQFMIMNIMQSLRQKEFSAITAYASLL